MTRSADLLAAALAAAEQGWYVFPLRPGSKKPALHGYRSCPRTGPCVDGHQGWEQRATTDPERITRCWQSEAYNIGLATGPSGRVVVDLDVPKSPDDVPPEGWNRGGIRDGADVFTVVCQQAGQPVPWDTRTVATPSGGTHLCFRAPAALELRNTQGEDGGLGWKVDTRAWGGYVVAPSSITPHGDYRLTNDREDADLPAWLVQALAPKPSTAISAPRQIAVDRLSGYLRSAVDRECQRVAQAQPGQHKRSLYIAAVALGQLVAGGTLPTVTAEQALTHAAQGHIASSCDCTPREVARTIGNGLRDGAKRPRTLPATGRVA